MSAWDPTDEAAEIQRDSTDLTGMGASGDMDPWHGEALW